MQTRHGKLAKVVRPRPLHSGYLRLVRSCGRWAVLGARVHAAGVPSQPPRVMAGWCCAPSVLITGSWKLLATTRLTVCTFPKPCKAREEKEQRGNNTQLVHWFGCLVWRARAASTEAVVEGARVGSHQCAAGTPRVRRVLAAGTTPVWLASPCLPCALRCQRRALSDCGSMRRAGKVANRGQVHDTVLVGCLLSTCFVKANQH